MNTTAQTTIRIEFAKKTLGKHLSKSYPYIAESGNFKLDGLTFILYVEHGTDKWDVHGIAETNAYQDTESLMFAGQVRVPDEETLLEWFPEFSSWINQTLPRNFKLH